MLGPGAAGRPLCVGPARLERLRAGSRRLSSTNTICSSSPPTAVPAPRIEATALPAAQRRVLAVLGAIRAGRLMLKTNMLETSWRSSRLASTPFTQLSNLTFTPSMSVPLAMSPAEADQACLADRRAVRRAVRRRSDVTPAGRPSWKRRRPGLIGGRPAPSPSRRHHQSRCASPWCSRSALVLKPGPVMQHERRGDRQRRPAALDAAHQHASRRLSSRAGCTARIVDGAESACRRRRGSPEARTAACTTISVPLAASISRQARIQSASVDAFGQHVCGPAARHRVKLATASAAWNGGLVTMRSAAITGRAPRREVSIEKVADRDVDTRAAEGVGRPFSAAARAARSRRRAR